MVYNLYAVFKECVLHEMSKFNLDESLAEDAMEEIHYKYSISGLDKQPNSLDFNRVELRCSYVYLYCTAHVRMVLSSYESLTRCSSTVFSKFLRRVLSEKKQLNYCSVGGGPGSDVVATLLFLKEFPELNGYKVKINLLDGYPEWSSTFNTIMERFNKRNMLPDNSYKFTFQDLLKPLTSVTVSTISQAHLITMVKFVSAISAEPSKADNLLRSIFNMVDVTTIVLLIDNSGGGYFENAVKTAQSCGFEAIVRPKKHWFFKVDQYLEPDIQYPHFYKAAQKGSKVSVAFLQKEKDLSKRGRKRVRQEEHSSGNIPKSGTTRKSYAPYKTPSIKNTIVRQKDARGTVFYSATPEIARSSLTVTDTAKTSTPRLPPRLAQRKLKPDNLMMHVAHSSAPSVGNKAYSSAEQNSTRNSLNDSLTIIYQSSPIKFIKDCASRLFGKVFGSLANQRK